MADTEQATIAWQPLPGSQAHALACPCDEILYHGTRGPGKTEAQLAYFVSRCGRGYGNHWRGIIFDRGYKNLADVVAKSHVMIPKVFPRAKFRSAKSDYFWQFPDGERLYFRHIKRSQDYREYHGHEYPFIAFNELTSYPTSELYDSMKSCNRSGFAPLEHSPLLTPDDHRVIEECQLLDEPFPDKIKARILPDIPLVMFSTTNPHGPGHSWVKRRFIDKAPPGRPVKETVKVFNPRTKQEEEVTTTRVHIFGSYRENRFLDPKYVAFLNGIKDPNKRRAWLGGDWSITSGGALDDLWRASTHVLKRSIIPRGWRITRSFDWGSSHPFSVGFWAVANGEEMRLFDGKRFCPARGSLIRIAEIYGCETYKDETGRIVPAYGTNKGLRISAREVARRIVETEEELFEEGWIQSAVEPGPADGQIFNVNEKESDSIAQLMESEGVRWNRADKSAGTRKNGLEMVRVALENATQGEGAGLYVMDNCQAFLETVPSLPRDEDDQDDVSTVAEDHCFIAGTMVETSDGPKPIEKLVLGEMVHTRKGMRPIIETHTTPEQKVYRVQFSNGEILVGTGNHPVFANGEFKRIDLLMVGDTLTPWKQKSYQKQFRSSTAKGSISAGCIFNAKVSGSTAWFGKLQMALSGKDTTSTMSTMTDKTMIFGTLKRFLDPITSRCTQVNQRKSKGKQGPIIQGKQPKGIYKFHQKNAGRHQGKLGRKGSRVRLFANSVQGLLRRTWLRLLSFAPVGARPAPTVDCVTFEGIDTVHNITVSDCHEYFANGVLVHNCYDEVRYMVLDDKPSFSGSVDIGQVF